MTTFKTTGTCSRVINYEVEDGVVTKCEFVGGCPGNTQGVAKLVVGRKVEEVISLLKGIQCRNREGRMHLGGSQSRSSARAFISLPTTGNTSPRRAWRRFAVIARTSSALVSLRQCRQTTAGKRRCEATPYSSLNTPAPAVAAAAWRSGGKFQRERPSRPRDKRELLTF